MALPIRLVYLVSHYPTVNHSFILREIVGLRAVGFDIQVIAIRGADRPADSLLPEERSEHDRMWTVLPAGPALVRAHLATLFGRPAAYLKGLFYALALSPGGLRGAALQVAYFAEALAAGYCAQRAGYRHIHSHFSSTVALIACRVFGFGLSISIHGPDEFRSPKHFRMREKLAASVFVTAISHYARSQTMFSCDPADWSKIEVCRLGVDPQVFAPAPVEHEGMNVICVGRLANVKAQRVLIDACGGLIRRGLKLTLHLVGGGPERASLERHAAGVGIADHVVFHGPRNQAQVIALYSISDVFALASFAEGIPVVLMEAMSMELPCVATWVNGIPELIRHGESGLLVAPSDEEGLAGAIAALLGEPELRRQVGKAARAAVLREYDLARNTQTLADVFRRYVTGTDS